MARETLLTVDAVAAQLGVSRRCIYRLIAKGDLTAIQVGGCKRIEPNAVDAFKRAHRVHPAPVPEPRPSVRYRPVTTSQLGTDRYCQ